MESKKASAILWTIIVVLVLVIAVGSYFIFSSENNSSESSENIATNGENAGGEAVVNGNEDDSINQNSNEESPTSDNSFCTDSDGGANYDIKGETCNEVDCKQDSCYFDEIDGKMKMVSDYFCEGDKRIGSSKRCDYLCEDGVCIPEPEPKCTDSDDGIDYSVKGKVITENIPGNSGEFEDKCLDSEELMENYCGPGQGYNEGLEVAKVTMYKCPNGCRDGACI
jgi:hypothetical protein